MPKCPDRSPGPWRWEQPAAEPVIPVPTVDVTPNPVVATILGPKGEPISQARARPSIRFGYSLPEP